MYAYAMWISPSFHLKVIRTFDMVTSAPEKLSGQAADKMQAGVILLDFMRRELNLSNSSVLGACQKLQEAVGLPNLAPRYAIDAPAEKLQEAVGLPNLAPRYAIDAPADAPDGSSRPTLSLSALLKQYGIRLTANQAYHQMVKLGIVEQRERYSRTAINNITQNYELIVKGIRNFENKVTVTLALRDKKRFDGEIFDLDISLDRVEGAALEVYEAAARRSIRQVFLDVAAGLCEGDEQSPEKRPVILDAQNVWITYKGKLPGRITGSLKTPPESQP